MSSRLVVSLCGLGFASAQTGLTPATMVQTAQTGISVMSDANTAMAVASTADCAKDAMFAMGGNDECCQWSSQPIACYTDMSVPFPGVDCLEVGGNTKCQGGSLIPKPTPGICTCKDVGGKCVKGRQPKGANGGTGGISAMVTQQLGKAYCAGGTAPVVPGAASPPPLGYGAPPGYAAPPPGYVPPSAAGPFPATAPLPPVSAYNPAPQTPARLYDAEAAHHMAIMNQNRRKHALAWTYCGLIYVAGALVIFGTFTVVRRRLLTGANQISEEEEAMLDVEE